MNRIVGKCGIVQGIVSALANEEGVRKLTVIFIAVSSSISQPRYIKAKVDNLSGRKAKLISSDDQPSGGFSISPASKPLILEKTMTTNMAILFRAIDAETGDPLFINNVGSYRLIPQSNPNDIKSITITATGTFVNNAFE